MKPGVQSLRFSAGEKSPWFLRPEPSPRLLVFDLDGTLAPIVSTPGRARVRSRIRRALARLAACPGTEVAVLSGRSLAEAARKVGVPGLIYFGNHGLTSTFWRLGIRRRDLELWTSRAAEARRRLAPLAREYPGCLVEFKGPDLSLHYRRLSSRRIPSLLRTARKALRGLGFAEHAGKRVLEFRPPLGTDKGTALADLARRLAPGWRRSGFCLYAGDDRTDEDAFLAGGRLGPRAVTIKVGPGATRAKYRLTRQADIERLLAGLAC
jgi:trehalose 6-phosphate phosphatase